MDMPAQIEADRLFSAGNRKSTGSFRLSKLMLDSPPYPGVNGE
jgi:hypothetical protein